MQLDGASFLSVQISVILAENKIVKNKTKQKNNKKNPPLPERELKKEQEQKHLIIIILHSQILTL